jgi:hypothetical protein
MSEPPFTRQDGTPGKMSDKRKHPKRTPEGTFPKGVSGNPTGRPKSETAFLRKKLAGGAPDVVRAVLEAAKGGDMTAAKLVLDRICPPLKAKAQAVTLDLPTNPSPLAVANAIISATAAGGLSPDSASQLIVSVSALSKIEETEELRDRIMALEKAITQPTKLEK